MRFVLLIWLLTAGLSSATLLPAPALAQVVCSGHKLLSSPRPESSCSSIKPRISPSPDGALRARARAARRYQPLRHARYGKPRRDPDQQRRYRDLEGLLVAARHQRLLCRQCKMVAGFAILCLQHGVIGWSFALVIPDDGVQPGEETHRWIERHDRWEADAFAGFPLCRRAYAHGSDVENARLTGRQDSSHSRSRGCVRQAAGFPCTHKSGPANGAMSAPGGTTRTSLPRRIWSTLFGASETIVVF